MEFFFRSAEAKSADPTRRCIADAAASHRDEPLIIPEQARQMARPHRAVSRHPGRRTAGCICRPALPASARLAAVRLGLMTASGSGPLWAAGRARCYREGLLRPEPHVRLAQRPPNRAVGRRLPLQAGVAGIRAPCRCRLELMAASGRGLPWAAGSARCYRRPAVTGVARPASPTPPDRAVGDGCLCRPALPASARAAVLPGERLDEVAVAAIGRWADADDGMRERPGLSRTSVATGVTEESCCDQSRKPA